MNYLICHLVGDYLLQNDWMVFGKKKSNLICGIHVFLYMLPFLFLQLPHWAFALIGFQHYIQDRTNFVVWFMKKKGQEEFATGVCSPWSIIVVDNVLHLVFIHLVILVTKL
jgi:formate/nitrite transporter FocA (FNT family)